MAIITPANRDSPTTTISSSHLISPFGGEHNDDQGTIETTIPTTFTCFSQLPLELRRQIWGEFACCDPEIVNLFTKWVYYLDSTTGTYTFWNIYRESPPPPAEAKRFFCYQTHSNAHRPPTIIQVSSEARAVGFEFYVTERTSKSFLGCFNVPVDQSELPTYYNRPIWVNWTTDTLIAEAPETTNWVERAPLGYPKEIMTTVTGHLSKVLGEVPKGKARVAFHSVFRESLEPSLVVDELILYARLAPIYWDSTYGFETIPFEDASPKDEFAEAAIDPNGNGESGILRWWIELCEKFSHLMFKLMLWKDSMEDNRTTGRWYVSVSEAGSSVYGGKCTEPPQESSEESTVVVGVGSTWWSIA